MIIPSLFALLFVQLKLRYLGNPRAVFTALFRIYSYQIGKIEVF